MSTKKCQVENGNRELCGREALGTGEKCLFHATTKTPAEEETFWEEFEKLLELPKEELPVFNFCMFVFPAALKDQQPFKREWDRPVTFRGATFTEGADFTLAMFTEGANFTLAMFTKGANFTLAMFTKKAYFTQARFNERANFTEATFTKRAYFPGVTFTERADFLRATFTKRAYFTEATFTERADFFKTTFTKRAYFPGVTFTEGADFLRATFTKGAYFSGATFTKGISIVEAIINGEVSFSNACFPQPTTALVNLRKLNWGDKGRIEFDQTETQSGQDLSAVCFSHTDLVPVIFRNVKWNKKSGRFPGSSAHWLTGDAYSYYHEKSDPPLATHVAQVYRRLRDNFEQSKRYADAGGFFVGEMEMKRLGNRLPTDASWRQRLQRWIRVNFVSSHAWYKYMSNYGESYWRVALWCGLVWLLFAGVGFLMGDPWETGLEHSTFVFCQLRTETMLDVGERALALLLFAQLFIALRRQFERR